MENDSLITKFFENTLSPQERERFEKRLREDAAFNEEVEFQKKTKIALTLKAREDLKARLQEVEEEVSQKPKRTWLYVAAIAILLLGIIGFFSNQSISNEKLYAKYYEPYPNVVAPVVRSSSENTLESNAFASYESENFENAAVMFETLANSTEEDYPLFYKANALMAAGQLEEAKDVYLGIPQDSQYRENADWYLALIYLKQDKVKESKELLKIIADRKSYNHVVAEDLLENLKEKNK